MMSEDRMYRATTNICIQIGNKGPSVGEEERKVGKKHIVVSSSLEPQGLVPFGACLDCQQQKTHKNSHTSLQKHTRTLSLGENEAWLNCASLTHISQSPRCVPM